MKNENATGQGGNYRETYMGKDSTFSYQKQLFYAYLKNHTATASMVSEATGIPQKNICRFKREFEIDGLLWELERKICQKTGFPAWYLTTNQELAPIEPQFKLFQAQGGAVK